MKKLISILLFLIPAFAFAQLELPFSIKMVNPNPLDFWYFESDNTPYDNTTEVTIGIPLAVRYRGMTVNVSGVEYWFKNGTTNGDLTVKNSSYYDFIKRDDTTNIHSLTRVLLTTNDQDDIGFSIESQYLSGDEGEPYPFKSTALLNFGTGGTSYFGVRGDGDTGYVRIEAYQYDSTDYAYDLVIKDSRGDGLNKGLETDMPINPSGLSVMPKNYVDTKQPNDSDLTAIAGLTPANDDFLQRKSGAWTNRTIAQVKTDLGIPYSFLKRNDTTKIKADTRIVATTGTENFGFGGGGDPSERISGLEFYLKSIYFDIDNTGQSFQLSSRGSAAIDFEGYTLWESTQGQDWNASQTYISLDSAHGITMGHHTSNADTFNISKQNRWSFGGLAGSTGEVLKQTASGMPRWSSGATAWGSITGTLSDQTDLQTALNLKANLASPTFTGIPAAPTAAGGTNTTQLATTAFVTAPLALKAPLASPALTGVPTAPTATAGNNSTQIATTAYVDNLAITLPVTVPNGGLGVSSLTAYSLLAGGTTSTGNIQQISGVGSAGQSLVSNGAGALPTWQDYYWKILGTTTLSGVSTQTSNAASQHIFNGTWTATANNDAHIKISPTLTTRNTASDNLYGVTISPTMAVNAGNPATTTMAGLFLNPTFSGTLSTVMGLKSESTVAGAYQHVFRNLSSGATAGTSIAVGNDAATLIGIVNATSSANSSFGGTAGSFNIYAVGGSANLVFGTGATPRIIVSPVGNQATTQAVQSATHTFITHTQSAHSAGTPSGLLWTGGAHTNMTAGGSFAEINFNLNRTIQWASNTGVSIYKGALFQAPTLAFASATGTVTTASTVNISGAPVAGTNAAITNTYALYVESGETRLGGAVRNAYVAKTALYTLTAADYTVEVTSGTHTQTLPTAVGIAGRTYVITNSGAGVVTIATTSSQTFVNVVLTPTTLTLNQYQTVTVQSNGANWLRLSTL